MAGFPCKPVLYPSRKACRHRERVIASHPLLRACQALVPGGATCGHKIHGLVEKGNAYRNYPQRNLRKEETMDKELSFEEALKRLEQIVSRLEDEEIPLEKALKTFEEGIRLSRYCNRCLDEAEKKIQILTSN